MSNMSAIFMNSRREHIYKKKIQRKKKNKKQRKKKKKEITLDRAGILRMWRWGWPMWRSLNWNKKKRRYLIKIEYFAFQTRTHCNLSITCKSNVFTIIEALVYLWSQIEYLIHPVQRVAVNIPNNTAWKYYQIVVWRTIKFENVGTQTKGNNTPL